MSQPRFNTLAEAVKEILGGGGGGGDKMGRGAWCENTAAFLLRLWFESSYLL